ncbi:MAG: bifunctional [glutamate--ammonia ligase]-adenylyl-L-tyrosine phosphorylase/[glutamate--ammonia-ligase] adenylyltransferase [Desulfomonilaceae bacterium]|nr:bifunctional [glutamate--ammonia ligase]-adenylyl-L-tyrosine phosphorylase/[glutamate--ammonia-ligase] adenylyltransferase [Desulfomonilaceae bacterium]
MDASNLSGYMERNCPATIDLLSSVLPGQREELLNAFRDTPNPAATVGRLDDLLSEETQPLVRKAILEKDIRDPFLATIGGSQFLFSILRRTPELLNSLFLAGGFRTVRGRAVMARELEQRLDDIHDTAGFDRVLRLYKEEEYLRIGCRDLAGLADTREVMAELSDFAAACIQAALDFHKVGLITKYGTPEGVGDQVGLAVLGLGKVAGRELNFSSDVDLIFLRGPEEGRTQGPQGVPVLRFYESLVRSVVRSLSDITEDGFVFRVDLRLRPEGEKGELVPSITNAIDYYLGWGRTWERAAMMKAVPVAGDIELGAEFMEELEPFIYRKHLDYSTLEDMRAMKMSIQSQLKRKPGLNIKLGQGGIREIEFFVQALQLINAGRKPRVRSSGTLRALALLREAGLLDETTSEGLAEAYLFFRKIEHRIQINHQLQTHDLPKSREEQEELARRLGYRDDALPAFLRDLDERRRFVEDLFSSMFHQTSEETLLKVSSRTRRLVETIHDELATLALLEEYGFEDPAASYPILRDLVDPSPASLDSEKGRTLLARLAPLLIEELLKVPEPGGTLVSLAAYIESLQSSSGYFSTLLENPPTVGFLMKILGESGFFTELLIHHPQAIDSLISSGAHEHPTERRPLAEELSDRLAFYDDFEVKLDVIRIFKHEEMLLIGVRHLLGEIESTGARWLVTELAEACLEIAVELAAREMTRKYGPTDLSDTLPFVVLAMGKFGGMEMTYLSDLDVIFIYDSPVQEMGRLGTHEWFTRLANRIISILSVPTSEGTAFAIDTRLRPSGNKGPLVCSLDAFREYHRTSSQLWEKQALIKGRTVIGPPEPAGEVQAIVRDCIMRTEPSDDDIREIARLRSRMQRELALEDELHVDMKTGHGGMVDVEFFVQGHILKYAKHHPRILCRNTLEALAEMRRAGLLDKQTFLALDSGYRFLSNLEDRLRIMEHRSVNRMPLAGKKLSGLAVRMGYGNGREEDLLKDYFATTNAIRRIYASFFGKDGTERPNG